MKPLTPKEAEEYLRRGGYVLDHVRGSHYIWIHPQTGKSVPVPHHGNHVIPQGTLQSIFDNVAKSGIDPRGVGLSQTDSDKKLRSYI